MMHNHVYDGEGGGGKRDVNQILIQIPGTKQGWNRRICIGQLTMTRRVPYYIRRV